MFGSGSTRARVVGDALDRGRSDADVFVVSPPRGNGAPKRTSIVPPPPGEDGVRAARADETSGVFFASGSTSGSTADSYTTVDTVFADISPVRVLETPAEGDEWVHSSVASRRVVADVVVGRGAPDAVDAHERVHHRRDSLFRVVLLLPAGDDRAHGVLDLDR